MTTLSKRASPPLRTRLLHKHIGPTTLHLHHEIYLLVTLILLTSASLQSLYRHSFLTTWGDVHFLLLTTLWLSRHLVVRVLCTSDDSTTSSPTLKGLLGNFIGRYCSGGQYYDPPARSADADGIRAGQTPHYLLRYVLSFVRAWIVRPLRRLGEFWTHSKTFWLRRRTTQSGRQITGSNAEEQASGYGGGTSSASAVSGGRGGGEHFGGGGPFSATSPSSAGVSSSSSGGTTSHYLTTLAHRVSHYRSHYVPPAQLLLAFLTVSLLLFGHVYYSTYEPNHPSSSSAAHRSRSYQASYALSGAGGFTNHASSKMNQQLGGSNNQGNVNQGQQGGGPDHFHQNDGRPRGGFGNAGRLYHNRVTKPGWDQVLFYILSGGTLAVLGLYGRVLLPVPDLVAGSNVLRAVRAEAKVYAGGGGGIFGLGGGGGGGGKTKRQRSTGSTGTSSWFSGGVVDFFFGSPNSKDVPWSECYKSVTLENRLKLWTKVGIIRIIENAFLTGWLPQTAFVCRFAEHCAPGPVLWELTRGALNPGGIPSDGFGGGGFVGGTMFDSLVPDRGGAILIGLSAVVCTGALLVAQMVTLDRSYLAIMGYISGEWTVVEGGSFRGGGRSGGGSDEGGVPMQWDPRRRYKKGDLILQNNFGLSGERGGGGLGGEGALYRATSNNPEGRPFDFFLRSSHAWFRNELGHPGSSRVIAMAGLCQVLFIGLIVGAISLYWVLEYDVSALVLTLVANLVALHGTVRLGLMDYDELDEIAEEISKPIQERERKRK